MVELHLNFSESSLNYGQLWLVEVEIEDVLLLFFEPVPLYPCYLYCCYFSPIRAKESDAAEESISLSLLKIRIGLQ